MTIDAMWGPIPQFTMGDRLRKARELAGVESGDFADEIGVSRNTITNYERDKVRPRKIVLNAWALRTGVPLQWLLTGTAPASPPEGDAAEAVDTSCARRDSNPQPSGLEPFKLLQFAA
jgi:transcriptional regulator with XRE-family HTH domain